MEKSSGILHFEHIVDLNRAKKSIFAADSKKYFHRIIIKIKFSEMYNSSHRYCFLAFLFFISSVLFALVPSGYYYFAKNKKQAALKTALHSISAPQFLLDYGGGQGFTWEGFFYTDQKTDGSVVDMYSNTVRKFAGFAAVDGMHIEHSFPKSWWGAHNNDAYKDLFHLYPADATTNITKSNLPLGEVMGTPMLDNGVTKIGTNAFGTEYSDNCFEPANEFKGDFARSYFYISTIYENYSALWASPMLNNNTYPVWKPWAMDLLLKWHRQDPVSAKELARIEAVYNIQGNRNPFIDYPDLAEYIWGTNTDKVYPFPEETESFLLTPRRGAKVDFGVILASDTRTIKLPIQGVNIAADLHLSLLGTNSSLSVSPSVITAANAQLGSDINLLFSPLAAGLVRDTLLVQGGGLTESLRIPLKALASSTFITLEPDDITSVGGNLKWISDPQAVDYKLSVYQGDPQAGDLIISAYVEGSSWNKALELYNGTGRTINLADYSLSKQSDGAGSFGATTQLSGLLENNKTYTLVHRKSTNTDLYAKAQLLDTLVLNMNGNDAIALQRNGVTIDMIGQANAGAEVIWGLDKTLERKVTVTHPIATFNASEWTTYPIDTWTMLGSHSLTLTSTPTYFLQNQPVGKITSYSIQNLAPENTYTYNVEAQRADGNVVAVNTMQLHTSALDVPILMQPTSISTTSFTANWEETLYASGYLLNVFEQKGAADTIESERFDLVGTAGKPLPTGWTGTASGNYTSTQSSGIAIPSIALKAEGEYLQTKNYPIPLKKFTLMYKFASTATGSSLAVYALKNTSWQRIDSLVYSSISKVYPLYTFTAVDAVTAVRFIYHKAGSANIAIDDVQATYGNLETAYVLQNKPIVGTQEVVNNLKENTNYYYNVRATLVNSVSAISETVGLKTGLNSGMSLGTNKLLKILARPQSILVQGLKGNEMIRVFTPSGVCITSICVRNQSVEIPLAQVGVFLVSIQNSDYTFIGKCLK